MMKVAVTGATGFVGSRLVEKLVAAGRSVIVLSRNPDKAKRVFPPQAFPNLTIVAYNPAQIQDWQQALAGCDGVVNLAGEPIADSRWTAQQKENIRQSRVLATQSLVEAIAQVSPKPSVLVNASAIGFYGTSETASFDETSPSGQGFLAQVCQDWETTAQGVKKSRTRLVILRIGIVVGDGGAIAKMVLPFRLFGGGPLGTGQQWFSWIHRDDLVNLILKALDDRKMEGVYNATAPNPVIMEELCQTLGRVLNRPSWLPVPDVALELLLGEGAQVVLQGQKVLPQRTLQSGFQYQYPKLEAALKQFL
jgi:uncharacterized protein (TIGR01777 family)